MGLFASSRNFGWGRSLAFAGRSALRSYYAGGHFATVAAHAARWSQFASWLKGQGVRDLAQVAPAHVEAYARALVERGVAPATAQNAVTSVNTVMRAATAGRWVSVSPVQAVGLSRSTVRQVAPYAPREAVLRAAEALRAAGHARGAAVLELAREFGVRAREASLADLDRWAREAAAHGRVNVLEGAKGGRTAERWVPVTDRAREALQRALEARPAGSRNLLAPNETWRQWRDGELRHARNALKNEGIQRIHDLRGAWACDRYRELTGRPAPVEAGARQAAREADRAARQQIAQELGHGRTDVTAAYLGSSR